MTVLAGVLTLGLMTGWSKPWLGALLTSVTEGGMACLIVVSAGGYGFLVIRRFAAAAPIGLRLATAAGLGLWIFSTAVLVVGTALPGALRWWLWWPVVAAGVALAAWQGRDAMEKFTLPARFDGRALAWVVLAVAAGIWLAGATRLPGSMWTPDAYDVLEYHLQVPREFYHAGRIGQLRHNCYSYYPLGTEMLFLLGMCLRNGPYQGMYLAKMLHGIFGVLAVAAVFAALKDRDESRGRFSAVLLGTVPMVIYLSWLAMVELALIFYAILAVLWLREWLARTEAGSAICIGLAAGAACTVKYLALGLLVAPVAAVMLALSLPAGNTVKRTTHAILTVLVAGLFMSPWLVRNLAYTRNPVFPLATTVFGRGHWSAESQQRWVDGHGPNVKPPVPVPPGWRPVPRPGRAEMLFDNFMTSEQFSPMLLLLAGVGVCAVIAAGRSAGLWDWSLVGILILQIAVWTAFAHQMPPRFVAPALGPISLLAGGMLGRLASVRTNPLRRGRHTAEGGPWGRPVALALLAAALIANLAIGYRMYRGLSARFDDTVRLHGQSPFQLQMASYLHHDPNIQLPADARFCLLGETRCWYWPVETVYATAFDSHPLVEMAAKGLPARQVLDDLRGRGITHLVVSWYEIWRLAGSYGYPAAVSAELFTRWQAGGPPGLKLLDDLQAAGLRKVADLEEFTALLRWAPNSGRVVWPVMSIYAMPWAPVTTRPATQPTTRPAG